MKFKNLFNSSPKSILSIFHNFSAPNARINLRIGFVSNVNSSFVPDMWAHIWWVIIIHPIIQLHWVSLIPLFGAMIVIAILIIPPSSERGNNLVSLNFQLLLKYQKKKKVKKKSSRKKWKNFKLSKKKKNAKNLHMKKWSTKWKRNNLKKLCCWLEQDFQLQQEYLTFDLPKQDYTVSFNNMIYPLLKQCLILDSSKKIPLLSQNSQNNFSEKNTIQQMAISSLKNSKLKESYHTISPRILMTFKLKQEFQKTNFSKLMVIPDQLTVQNVWKLQKFKIGKMLSKSKNLYLVVNVMGLLNQILFFLENNFQNNSILQIRLFQKRI